MRERAVRAGGRQHPLAREPHLLEHERREVGPVPEREVARRDPLVGLAQRHLDVVDQRGEQRPVRVGRLELGEVADRREGGAQPEPPREVGPRLRPREHPRDRPQVVQGLHRQSPARRARADGEQPDLLERRDLGEPGGEPVRADQRVEPGPRGLVQHRCERGEPGGGGGIALRQGRRPGEQGGGGDLLDVAGGDDRVAVPGKDDLALLGDLEPAVDRPGRLGEQGPVGRAAPAPERPAAAVEQRQREVVPTGPLRDLALRDVERERRGDRADVLGRVGVAEHDLDAATVGRQAALHGGQVQHRLKDVDARGKVGVGLEQGDGVDHRSLGGVGEDELGQLVHRREVFRLLGKRDDEAPRRLDPVATLHRPDRAERVEHLRGPGGERAVDAELGDLDERRSVHLGVLAQLELGEVKAEGLHLPDEPLQVAVRGARRACRDQRSLHHGQVLDQLVGARVGEVRVAAPRRGDPLRHHEQRPAVRLVGRVGRDLGGEDLGQLTLPLPQREQLGRRRRARAVVRQGAAGAARRGLERREDVLGRDDGGGAGHVRRHVRVAVAVAPDPRAEADERAHDRGLRAGRIGLQPVVEPPVDLGEHVEEGRVEHGHDGPHLVEHHRLGCPERRRAPEHVDLGQQAPLVLGQRRPADVQRVALRHQVRDPPDRGGDRAPAGLGGMGGDDRAELELLQPRDRRVEPDLLGQGGHGCREGVVRGELVRGQDGLPTVQRADAVVLLGEVREVEVARESARDLFGPGRGEALDEILGLDERFHPGLVVGADRQLAQPLDVGQQLAAASLAEHRAEEAAEQPDVVAQRVGDVVPGKATPDVLRGGLSSHERNTRSTSSSAVRATRGRAPPMCRVPKDSRNVY